MEQSACTLHPPDEEAGCDDIIVNVDEADEAEDGAAAGDTTARSSRCARDAGMMAVEAAN